MPSTAIRSYRYLKDRKILEVTFVGGGRYHYLRVPEQIAREMETARSKGTFVNQQIKPNFDYVRLEGVR